ncbi:MAG: acyl carrier protein [Planctomycetes bacterium]|nr:acyl carrier protein [Planctomycetota bacterium]
MPTTQEISEKVTDIVCKQLGVAKDKVKPETSFINDLGADSLDTVELVMEIEDAFELSIPEEDADKIQTVGHAIKYIESKLG